MRDLFENILPQNHAFEDFEVEHDFKFIGRKTMLLRAEGAYLFAESLREKIENLNIEHKYSIIGKNVTVSMGVATMIPDKDGTQDELISTADNALYKA